MTVITRHCTLLVLENGSIYYGWSLCRSVTIVGELIFNTGMTGYQEIITDPSYCQQIVVFTYSEMGNTGVNFEDIESNHVYVKGLILKNLCLTEKHWRQTQSFADYLYSKRIPHLYGIDTRILTRSIRNMGAVMACISNLILNIQVLCLYFKSIIRIDHRDLVQTVSTNYIYAWPSSGVCINSMSNCTFLKYTNTIYRKHLLVVVIDFGIKYNILRIISKYVKDIIVVPANIPYDFILKYKPDAVLLSNGPGNPSCVCHAVNTVNKLLLSSIPIFGICMGYQILALALRLNTSKLKFGHHGLNHPVGFSKIVNITSQNHCYVVQEEFREDVINWQVNYNDHTLSAIVHRVYPCFAVQYHPEASPGPNDTESLFLHFVQVIQTVKKYSTSK